MKKKFILTIGVCLVVALQTFSYGGHGNGMGGGCENCLQQGGEASAQLRKFQQDTLDLRQEMMLRRFELQRENLTAVPNGAKIAVLQAEISSLQAKITAARTKSGLLDDKSDGESRPATGGCGMGTGGCKKGPCGAQ